LRNPINTQKGQKKKKKKKKTTNPTVSSGQLCKQSARAHTVMLFCLLLYVTPPKKGAGRIGFDEDQLNFSFGW
jgi:hypothetical protein